MSAILFRLRCVKCVYFCHNLKQVMCSQLSTVYISNHKASYMRQLYPQIQICNRVWCLVIAYLWMILVLYLYPYKTPKWSIRYMFCRTRNMIKGYIKIMKLRQNGCHFADDIFKWIFLNENLWYSNEISLKYVPWGPFNNKLTLFQIKAWP